MDQNSTPLANVLPPDLHRLWGFWAMVIGGLGVLLVFAPFAWPLPADTPSVAQQVGEMAGEIRKAAWRSFLATPLPVSSLASAVIFNAAILGVSSFLFTSRQTNNELTDSLLWILRIASPRIASTLS